MSVYLPTPRVLVFRIHVRKKPVRDTERKEDFIIEQLSRDPQVLNRDFKYTKGGRDNKKAYQAV
jgi:hypothetical protein